ncbi:hypothetical protein WR25_18196 [Diploscapter pachys]|uniref:CHK kinase-like domain-containing protein n=1 Tax=Diploscapter pachys TaxID=2018661 RepID=A0A2A2JI59_9BILA|nr:hypothetical protein WR25_18196 [Diploscapter pachys]
MVVLPGSYLKSLLPADGLESALQKKFNTDARFGEEWRVESHAGGYSLCSLGILYPCWEGKRSGEELEEYFFVKIVRRNERMLEDGNGGRVEITQEQFERRNRRKREQHNIEVLGLQLLNSKEEFMTPKIYANNVLDEESDVGYIVLQAIHNARSLDIYDLMPDKTIIQAMKWLVRLQIFGACDILTEEKKKSMFREKADWVELISIQRLQRTIDRIFSGNMENGREDKVRRAKQTLLDLKKRDEDLVHNIDKDLGIEPVLCHGDMYSRNLMADENFDLKAVIDFQKLHYGNCAQDLTFLLFDLVKGKDKRSQIERFISIFYEMILEETNGHPLYSLDNLMESHRRMAALAALFDAKCYWMQSEEVVEKLEGEEMQQQALQTISDQYDALLEDFIFYHNENQKRFES